MRAARTSCSKSSAGARGTSLRFAQDLRRGAASRRGFTRIDARSAALSYLPGLRRNAANCQRTEPLCYCGTECRSFQDCGPCGAIPFEPPPRGWSNRKPKQSHTKYTRPRRCSSDRLGWWTDRCERPGNNTALGPGRLRPWTVSVRHIISCLTRGVHECFLDRALPWHGCAPFCREPRAHRK